jgi:replicative DNA helicase
MTLQSIDEYGPSFQMKVISSLLTHKEFLQNINDVLSDEYFSNPAHKWVINQIIQYYESYHTTISMDILKVEMKKLDNEVLKVSVKEQLREAYRADLEDLEYVQLEFSTFCKNQQLKKALLNSVDLLKAGDYDSIKYMIESDAEIISYDQTTDLIFNQTEEEVKKVQQLNEDSQEEKDALDIEQDLPDEELDDPDTDDEFTKFEVRDA